MINITVKILAKFSRYVSWLFQETGKPILPAIQVKDMPDSIPDTLENKELKKEFLGATKKPSCGALWFSWDGAVEKEKTDIISKINKSVP